MKTQTAQPIECRSQINWGNRCQESYMTTGRGATARARQLRALGYQVFTEALGWQDFADGSSMKITLVDIRPGTNRDTMNLPPVTITLAPINPNFPS